MEQMHIAHSEALYDRAKELMPGGVNSPVRAFSLWAVRRGLFSVPKTSTSTMRRQRLYRLYRLLGADDSWTRASAAL